MKRDACMEVLRAAIKKELLGKEIVETLPFPDLYNLARENKMLPLLVYVDYKQNIEETMERKENMEMLTSIIQGLKKKDREIVLRRYYYLQSSKEIAFHTGMSVNAIDSKLSRLRKQMKREYEILTEEGR